MDNPFHVVAALSDLPDGGQMHVELDGRELLLCHFEGEVFAVDYYCSHETFPLEGGGMMDRCVICPYHGAEFDLETGKAMAAPAFDAIDTYPVRIEDGMISLSAAPNPRTAD